LNSSEFHSQSNLNEDFGALVVQRLNLKGIQVIGLKSHMNTRKNQFLGVQNFISPDSFVLWNVLLNSVTTRYHMDASFSISISYPLGLS
jgi:hypothetical protein